MSNLFKTPKVVDTAPPPPALDNSRVAASEARRLARRGGRKSTILNGRPVADVTTASSSPSPTAPRRPGGRASTLLN
jgi:hypothetical protein